MVWQRVKIYRVCTCIMACYLHKQQSIFIYKNRNIRVKHFFVYWHSCRANYSHNLRSDTVTLSCNAVLHNVIWAHTRQNIITEWQAIQHLCARVVLAYRKLGPPVCDSCQRVGFGQNAFCFTCNFLKNCGKTHTEYFSSVGGHSTTKAYISWLTVPRGFSGHHVFHNDMERSLDKRVRGHPALSLLIPDSSFSLDSTSISY